MGIAELSIGDKSSLVTLNDLELRNGHYLASFHRKRKLSQPRRSASSGGGKAPQITTFLVCHICSSVSKLPSLGFKTDAEFRTFHRPVKFMEGWTKYVSHRLTSDYSTIVKTFCWSKLRIQRTTEDLFV